MLTVRHYTKLGMASAVHLVAIGMNQSGFASLHDVFLFRHAHCSLSLRSVLSRFISHSACADLMIEPVYEHLVYAIGLH
jgi:hypothetical protein